ncbi:MAG: hypothetical protein IJ225_08410 [Solobacterium sp.]|nr:hypothetical protein [Solobacterium sp.]
MKPKNKRFLSGVMIAGDIMMILMALILVFDEEYLMFGLLMLVFLAIDIYLTIDYIRALAHREKVEKSLRDDNEKARQIHRQWSNMNLRPKRTSQPVQKEEEEDLSDILSREDSPRQQTYRN